MPQFDAAHFPAEIIWTLVSFALLFALLKWLVLPRIIAALEARTRMIREEIEQARAQREQAETIRLQYEQRLQDIAAEAKRMFDEAEVRIRQERHRVMGEWKAEMKRREMSFHDEMEMARQQALRDIRQKTAELVTEATEKLLQRHIGEQDVDAVVDDILGHLQQEERKHTRH